MMIPNRIGKPFSWYNEPPDAVLDGFTAGVGEEEPDMAGVEENIEDGK